MATYFILGEIGFGMAPYFILGEIIFRLAWGNNICAGPTGPAWLATGGRRVGEGRKGGGAPYLNLMTPQPGGLGKKP